MAWCRARVSVDHSQRNAYPLLPVTHDLHATAANRAAFAALHNVVPSTQRAQGRPGMPVARAAATGTHGDDTFGCWQRWVTCPRLRGHVTATAGESDHRSVMQLKAKMRAVQANAADSLADRC
jgi:hypothetical protein